ncbi:MAG: Smr/MutS family protein [Desulfobacterales bacterium]|nr:Smr/MutS family protein [Desulfobacterales bacterium]
MKKTLEPIEFPITDILDLHTFLPAEVPDLLDDYFDACLEKGIVSVRIIHGKGTGTLKKRVRAILARHPLVAGFSEAPAEAGGWGATLVELRPDPRSGIGT